MGSILAVIFYRFVKVLEYETANPGADFNEQEAEVFEFDEENAATAADVARPVTTQLRGASLSSRMSEERRNDNRLSDTIESRLAHSSDGTDGFLKSSTYSGGLDRPGSGLDRPGTMEHMEAPSRQTSNVQASPGAEHTDTFHGASDAEKGESGLGLPAALRK
jgi:hypothetical protein